MTAALLTGLARGNVVDRLDRLFAAIMESSYLDENVTIGEHMLQAAACARRDGAPDTLIAAALLHDVGYYVGPDPGIANEAAADRRHDRAAARVLGPFFPPAVTEPIRLHVEAKRYLCAVEPDYRGQLSDASIRTMSLQGGIMSADEARAFAGRSCCEDAVRVRRWDDEGKAPGVSVPGFARYRTLLESLVAGHTP